jgi:hypothetical protein
MNEQAELLADCDAQGIRLYPAGDGDLTIDAPQAAMIPNMVMRLKNHKAELLALLQAPAIQSHPIPVMKPTAKPVCRCGSTVWRDVPIHDGQSMRRDCAGCGRFIDFPIWYREVAGRCGQ